VLILKIDKVLCFDTLSQVLILKGFTARSLARELWAKIERWEGADFAGRVQRIDWGADFMSYDTAK
jgi:hypothetical protein